MTDARSMTGYAAGQGAWQGITWTWDLRSVNGRGLDLRLRLPDTVPGLDAAVRTAMAGKAARGNVSISLRLGQEDGAAQVSLNESALVAVVDAMARAEAVASGAGLPLAPSTAAEVIAQRGVLEAGAAAPDSDALKVELLGSLAPLIDDFIASRAAEGAKLAEIIEDQVDQIAALTERAAALLDGRAEALGAHFSAALARVTDQLGDMDADRVAQEIAMLAVKADVTEEIDRLRAHVEAARTLLSAGGPIGRKLDFLTQEFNREANTLCSKAQHSDLTAIGLEMKTVIDQMREQVQNLE